MSWRRRVVGVAAAAVSAAAVALATVPPAVGSAALVAGRVADGRGCGPGREARASGALGASDARFRSVTRRDGTVVASTGPMRVDLTLDPFSYAASVRGRELVREAPAGGITLQRGPGDAGPVAHATSATVAGLSRCAVRLRLGFDDGRRAALVLRAHADDTVSFALLPDRPAGLTKWGETLVTPADEHIYGLTERIVNDRTASEQVPQPVGSLDRKGEIVGMYVIPTISIYTPFYQSSRGYGLLVDGTMPGRYDVGATTPDRLRLDFEIDPTAHAARWFVLGGPSHYALNDAFSRLTGRPVLPPEVVFTHWRGHDENPIGDPVSAGDVPMNALVADDILAYERYGIPPGIYHFDRPWAPGSQGIGRFAFDPERFPNAARMLEVMHDKGWSAQVWVSEWVLDRRGRRARRNGWLAPHSATEVDVTNPAAARSVVADLRAFLRSPAGRFVDGLFVDRTDEVVPSRSTDVYHDGRTGRQMHNAYPPLFQALARRAVDAERGRRGWVIARAGYTGSPALTMAWGGDTPSRAGVAIPEQPDTGPSTDLGLRSALVSLQRLAFLGQPYWGSDIGGYSEFADREVFARWIEVGAASPLMRFHGKGSRAPWNMPTQPTFDQEVLDIYRRYVLLHHALAPYLHDLAKESHRAGAPIVRPLPYDYPDDPRAANLIDEWKIGDDLLAAPVWQSGARRRDVYLPAGTWVDFWDRARVLQGAVQVSEDVPLDRLPLYVRAGSPLLGIAAP